jgi:hypothetical protein
MPEPETLISLFDKTLGAIGLIREGRQRRDERTDQALFALYTALGETRAYVSELAKGKRRNRKKELSIAHLWHNAAVPLRYIDKDLAHRCFLKGSYWLEPETWNKARIKRNGIALDTVFEKAREILLES